MMKNYKSIRNFYEVMQQKPHQEEQRNLRTRNKVEHEKSAPDLSIKKMIEFFKSIKP